MRYSVCVIVSAIVHLVLLLAVTKSGGEGDKDGAGKGPTQVSLRILDKKSDEKLPENKPRDGTLVVDHVKESKEHKESECKDSFVGIGVNLDLPRCVVTEVFAGYPAEKNGIQVGDIITSPACGTIVSDKPSMIDITIERGTKTIHLSFMREKICGEK